jgi:hypothetical protein
MDAETNDASLNLALTPLLSHAALGVAVDRKRRRPRSTKILLVARLPAPENMPVTLRRARGT